MAINRLQLESQIAFLQKAEKRQNNWAICSCILFLLIFTIWLILSTLDLPLNPSSPLLLLSLNQFLLIIMCFPLFSIIFFLFRGIMIESYLKTILIPLQKRFVSYQRSIDEETAALKKVQDLLSKSEKGLLYPQNVSITIHGIQHSQILHLPPDVIKEKINLATKEKFTSEWVLQELQSESIPPPPFRFVRALLKT